jgi:RND family efflux transporter MFP subunit
MKRSYTLVALLLASWILGTQSGCAKPSTVESSAEAAAPGAGGTAVERVTAGPPVRKSLELSTTQPGRLEAFEETPLHSKTAGYIEQVLVDIGDRVKKDDILVKLWVPELQDDVEQKEALLAQAEAEVRQSEAAIKAAQAAVATAQAAVAHANAGVARATAEFQRAKAEHTRVQQLAANGSVTQKLVDEALNAFRSAEAAQQEASAHVDSARAALQQAEAGVEKSEADLGAAQAQVRVANADLARARTMLAYTALKAPFDGVVTQRNVDTGYYVQSAGGGMSPLVTVARNDEVRVFVDVPEMDAALVDGGEEGDAVSVTIPALPGKQIPAKVRRTSWSLDPANRSLRVEIDLPNPEGALRPGMYATATILLDQRAEVLTLPITAIVRVEHETYCCTVKAGMIDRRKVELGLRSGGEVEVLSGIEANDTVVLTRAELLAPGQHVEILEPEKK